MEFTIELDEILYFRKEKKLVSVKKNGVSSVELVSDEYVSAWSRDAAFIVVDWPEGQDISTATATLFTVNAPDNSVLKTVNIGRKRVDFGEFHVDVADVVLPEPTKTAAFLRLVAEGENRFAPRKGNHYTKHADIVLKKPDGPDKTTGLDQLLKYRYHGLEDAGVGIVCIDDIENSSKAKPSIKVYLSPEAAVLDLVRRNRLSIVMYLNKKYVEVEDYRVSSFLRGPVSQDENPERNWEVAMKSIYKVDRTLSSTQTKEFVHFLARIAKRDFFAKMLTNVCNEPMKYQFAIDVFDVLKSKNGLQVPLPYYLKRTTLFASHWVYSVFTNIKCIDAAVSEIYRVDETDLKLAEKMLAGRPVPKVTRETSPLVKRDAVRMYLLQDYVVRLFTDRPRGVQYIVAPES